MICQFKGGIVKPSQATPLPVSEAWTERAFIGICRPDIAKSGQLAASNLLTQEQHSSRIGMPRMRQIVLALRFSASSAPGGKFRPFLLIH